MKVDQETLRRAEAILSKYALCHSCLGRQFATKGSYNSALGKMIRKETRFTEPQKCELCIGIIDELNDVSKDVIRALASYEFETFLIGTSIPSSMLESEDSLRAEFKLKGGESVKSEITKEIAKRIVKVSGKKFDPRNADLAILVKPAERFYTITPRSFYITARYTKRKRGLPQKRPKCVDCNGRGCSVCEWTGFVQTASVESIISNYLISIFDAKKVKFLWIGSEDDESLVLGDGRPFYAEILEPKKRKIPRKLLHAKLGNGIELAGGDILQEKPLPDTPFELIVEVNIKTSKPIRQSDLRTLSKKFRDVEIRQYSPNKRKFLIKKVRSLKTKKISAKRLKATIQCEGGINIKKLVLGNSSVLPSVSKVLGFECNTDPQKPFDILVVRISKPIERSVPVGTLVEAREGTMARQLQAQ